jgi:hypothetical protein
MRLASALVSPLVVLVAVAVVGSAGGCSGATATVGGGSSSGDLEAGSATDASLTNDGSSTGDGSSPIDSSTPDAGKDAGVVVNELPAPACNDLTQHADLVTAVGNPGSAPSQVPISTITPGLYVLASAVDYGGAQPIDPVISSRTTVVFTATRQYYLSEDAKGGAPQVFTLDWKITNNRLVRKVVCTQSAGQIGSVVDYRIDAQPKGFIIYVPSTGSGQSRLQAFRYDRVP